MENSAPTRNSFFATQLHIAINQCTYGKIVGKTTLNSIKKYFGGIECFSFHANSYRDYENFGKSTTSVSQAFIESLTILRVNKHFRGKLSTLVLFNDVTFIAAAIFLIVYQLRLKKQ